MYKKSPKRVHRVVLRYQNGITRSVFPRAHTRSEAEQKALKQNPDAIGIGDSPLSQR